MRRHASWARIPPASRAKRPNPHRPLAGPGEPGIMSGMSDDDSQTDGDGGFDGGDHHEGHHDGGGHFHGDGECGCDHEGCDWGDFNAEQRPYDEMERPSRSGCVLVLLALPAAGLLLFLR